MFFIADTQVHTTGINLGAVLAIVIPVVAVIISAIAYLDQRNRNREEKREEFVDKIQRETKDDITTAVNSLRDVLLERLETKEAVNQVRIEVAGVKAQISELRERVTHPGAL